MGQNRKRILLEYFNGLVILENHPHKTLKKRNDSM